MHLNKTISAVALVFFVTIGGFSLFYILNEQNSKSQNNDVASRTASDKPLSSYAQSKQPSSASQLQASKGSDTQRTSPQLPALPEPEEFSVYEEYSATESALYIDTVVGTGREVVAGDTVAMVYSGYLTNGQLFDQSRPNENNEIQPFVFTVGNGQVIPGWEQTIVGMKTGGQRRLIIPSEFGYGPIGQGTIPPNAMLIFDVQLVAIEGE